MDYCRAFCRTTHMDSLWFVFPNPKPWASTYRRRLPFLYCWFIQTKPRLMLQSLFFQPKAIKCPWVSQARGDGWNFTYSMLFKCVRDAIWAIFSFSIGKLSCRHSLAASRGDETCKTVQRIFLAECLHGGVDRGETQYGMTVFPQPLALAAAFDTHMHHEIASIISEEMRAASNMYRQADGTARLAPPPLPLLTIYPSLS